MTCSAVDGGGGHNDFLHLQVWRLKVAAEKGPCLDGDHCLVMLWPKLCSVEQRG